MVKLMSLSVASAGTLLFLVKLSLAAKGDPPALTGRLPVTGPPNPDGGEWTAENTPARLEIRELAQDETAMTLFLLALKRMQDPSDTPGDPRVTMDSYWRIAALHGVPYGLQWGPVGRREPQTIEYCYHEHTLFPPWHRPYLALYEQTVVKNAMALAAQLDGGNADGRWTNAAKTLRLPYWDWATPLAAGESAVPDIIAAPTYTYTDNDGEEQSIPNPLFEYVFPKEYPGAPAPPEQWDDYRIRVSWEKSLNLSPRTIRGTNYIQNLANIRNMLSTRVYNLLTDIQTYSAFSNRIVEVQDRVNSRRASVTHLSVEGIHDQIHGVFTDGMIAIITNDNDAGDDTQSYNSGHMFLPATASWDPVFWLHHANVDRITAMWQQAHPDLWFDANPNGGNGEDGTLRPFFKDQDQLWKAADVRDTKTFGYTYRDIASDEAFNAAKAKYMSQAAVGVIQEASQQQIQQQQEIAIQRRQDNSTIIPGPQDNSPDLSERPDVAAVRTNLPKLLSGNSTNTFTDYNCNIKLADTAFNESTTIHVFLGAGPSNGTNPALWPQVNSFVGYFNIWTGNMTDMEMPGADIGGSVPLTNALINLVISPDSGLKNLLPQTVSAYLRRNLKVLISDPLKRGIIDPKTVESLSITVSGTETTFDPTGEQQPTLGDTKTVYKFLTV